VKDALGARGGPLDAKDDLGKRPTLLITDPSLSTDNPNNPTHTAGTTFVGQFIEPRVRNPIPQRRPMMASKPTTSYDRTRPQGRRSWARGGVALLAALAFLAVSPAAGALPAGHSGNFPARIDLPNGFFPEGIESGPGTSFFIGSLSDGTIWRGDFRTGSGAVLAPGAPGLASAGIAYEARHHRIWVAGAGPLLVGRGDVRVYDASSGALLATYEVPGVGLMNDVAVTREAVYVTDSGFPQLVVIPLGRHGSLPPASAATVLPLGGDFVQTPGFNLNGIVAKNCFLLVDQSSTGKLFRVDPATGVAAEVDLGGASLGYTDGLELLGHTVYVVRSFDNRVTLISLGARLDSGVVLGDLTDPSLDIPSTATVAAGRLWAVNLRFTTPPEASTPYWITQLPLRP
jgi:hypothetical protein